MTKYYDWEKTLSYQTGTNGEICLVIGAKGIGKTFGLRKRCVEWFIKKGELFCEICRTNEEMKAVEQGYFDKLQAAGLFNDYMFKVEKHCGFIALKPAENEKPIYKLICYFVALTNFQREKKRTYVCPKRFIFDEAIIDTLDKYHRYLKNEFLILAQILDSISRQQPNTDYQYYVYMIGNAVCLTAPYFRHFNINKIPNFGYHWYKNKTVLLHYVEPWDAEERKAYTLVGRMLAGNEESATVFDNEFRDNTGNEIAAKSATAKYAFAIKWDKATFAIWVDRKNSIWYVCEKLPKDATNIYTLAKKDSSVNYITLAKTSDLLKIIPEMYRIGALRYESTHLREMFFEVLSFIGIK